MQYRTLPKSNARVSALGFGAMRLPTTGKEADVDEPAAIELLRYAFDRGVNYVDTAYVYHGGNGERVVGKALAGGYREKVFLATKLPIWSVQKLDDCGRLFDVQLERLQTGWIDYYLLHCLQRPTWPKMRDLGVLRWAEREQARGRIRHFGFSFHDSFETFIEIVDAYDWSFCQLQYNYVNEDVQAGTRGLEYAAGKGLGVIVMEPLFGGALADPPPAVRAVWNAGGDCPDFRAHHAQHGRENGTVPLAAARTETVPSPADVALRWLWNKPEVSLVLSGMNTRRQIDENLASAEQSGVGRLSDDEARLIDRARAEYAKLSPIPCTKCGYCLPCPQGVQIPVNFELSNQAALYGGNTVALCRNLYLSLPESQRAAACVACGTCEDRCPQKIPIAATLERVRQQFSQA